MEINELYKQGKRYFDQEQYADALPYLERAAEQGYSSAQFYLARMYNEGRGVPQNANFAVSLFAKAAEQGNTVAQFNLANMLKKGDGVARDSVQAVYWYEKAIASGSSAAMNNLGNMYRDADGVNQDYAKAASLYDQAARLGNERAQYSLAMLLKEGNGVQADLSSAIYWLKESAAKGREKAQVELNKLQGEYTNAPQARADLVNYYKTLQDPSNAHIQALRLSEGNILNILNKYAFKSFRGHHALWLILLFSAVFPLNILVHSAEMFHSIVPFWNIFYIAAGVFLFIYAKSEPRNFPYGYVTNYRTPPFALLSIILSAYMTLLGLFVFIEQGNPYTEGLESRTILFISLSQWFLYLFINLTVYLYVSMINSSVRRRIAPLPAAKKVCADSIAALKAEYAQRAQYWASQYPLYASEYGVPTLDETFPSKFWWELKSDYLAARALPPYSHLETIELGSRDLLSEFHRQFYVDRIRSCKSALGHTFTVDDYARVQDTGGRVTMYGYYTTEEFLKETTRTVDKHDFSTKYAAAALISSSLEERNLEGLSGDEIDQRIRDVGVLNAVVQEKLSGTKEVTELELMTKEKFRYLGFVIVTPMSDGGDAVFDVIGIPDHENIPLYNLFQFCQTGRVLVDPLRTSPESMFALLCQYKYEADALAHMIYT